MTPVAPVRNTPPRPFRGRAVLIAWLATVGAFLSAAAIITFLVPYRPGFDDGEHLRAALLWTNEWRLDAGGMFVRVPLFAVLLGTFFHAIGPLPGLVAFQALVVVAALGVFFLFVAADREDGGSDPARVAPVLLLAWSPLVLLYLRHAVSELWVGLLAMTVLYVGLHAARGRAVALGALCGAAAMTKLMALSLALPALWLLWRGRPGRDVARDGLRFAAAFALVAAPLLVLHLAQRPGLPLDNTSAFNLSGLSGQEWLEAGDARERQATARADLRQRLRGDPAGYVLGAGPRLWRFVSRPATADFTLYYGPGFPRATVGAWEQVFLLALLALAALGTTRATAPAWIFPAAVLASSVLPLHVPFTPKAMLIFPCLLLAPRGVERLRARLRR